jgi:hypothetical protein
VNLGQLKGDAVGIFAGTLKHSGLISATPARSEGGKVVLKGQEAADISGTITAQKGSLGGQSPRHGSQGQAQERRGH